MEVVGRWSREGKSRTQRRLNGGVVCGINESALCRASCRSLARFIGDHLLPPRAPPPRSSPPATPPSPTSPLCVGASVGTRRGMASPPPLAVAALPIASRIAREAGATIRAALPRGGSGGGGGGGGTEGVGGAPVASSKSNSTDLVTATDVAVQGAVFAALRRHYPDFSYIGEEDGAAATPLGASPTWIVDPIDGTANFVAGLADVCVSLALAVDRRVILGVVYSPVADELYTATAGGGAALNGVRLPPPVCDRLADGLVVMEWGYDRTPAGMDAMLAAARAVLGAPSRGVRQLGSGILDMCYVAAGRVAAVYTGVAGEGWRIWDYAAGGLIVAEAGGVVVGLGGGEWDWVGGGGGMVAAAPGVVDELVCVLAAAKAGEAGGG